VSLVVESPTPRVSRIRVYPLKGAAGVDLEETELDPFGIPWDRRWMLVRPDGGYISQRTHPRLCLIRIGNLDGLAAVEENGFTAQAPGMEPLALGPIGDGDRIEVKVHADRFSALRGNETADRWFSSFLGERCSLVYMSESMLRPVDPDYAPGHRVSFADGYPLHLTAEESLEALNGILGSPLSMLRFRPNLVVRGGEAWEEDLWRRVEVGTVTLEMVKPCARCSVTTVDPGTGTRGREPLRTFKGFREWEGEVYFGQNVVFLGSGRIRLGDRVRVLKRGEARPPLRCS
jgi:uncharacterized protein YcbX